MDLPQGRASIPALTESLTFLLLFRRWPPALELGNEAEMKRTIALLLLTGLMLWGCAETNGRSEMARRAATCAMCGASVTGDYFYYTIDRSMGPTNR
jgi:hypothetical protein